MVLQEVPPSNECGTLNPAAETASSPRWVARDGDSRRRLLDYGERV